MSHRLDPLEPPTGLVPTFEHVLAGQWSRPGGPWAPESLDDALIGDRDTERRVAAVAGGLAERGVRAGDAVAWLRPNGSDAEVLFRACWRLGAVASPLHHQAGRRDTDALLKRLRPTVTIGTDDPLPVGTARDRASSTVAPGSLAVALATSGSSGSPKLALHTHQALLYKARSMATVHQLGPQDCILLPTPMAHISGLLNGVLLTISGMRVVPMAKWDPTIALELIEREQVTFMIGPPTFFVSLIQAPTFSPEAVRSLRQISCGGAGVTPAFVRATAESLGCRVKRSYGSTEAPTVTTSTLDDDEDRAAETDGRPVGEVALRIVDPATGSDLDAGCRGEVWIRGPEVFVGYDDAAATALAFTADGWFRTGDLGTIDDQGWLTIVGRIKDVIIRGGENIAAAELEGVLEAHPGVRQAVVVGYPDHRLGERVCAVVVADDLFDLDACRSWFEEQGITRFKWPERIEHVDTLPLLSSGKPDRAALRRLVAGPAAG